MSEKTLRFNDVEVNKKKFHASKQPITLNSVLINKIVVSDKFEHSDILFVTKKTILLDLYVLYCLK